ncbi:MAG: substrate-binding domain-containing protein [Betaproteobacteria bacterium]|nr:substrate-binding domain-containing protein [Betaproteobacteria bacterium]
MARYTRAMDRRSFLSFAGAGLLIGPWREHAAAGTPAPGFSADDICRSARPLPIFVASTGAGELSYQGTHILAYGALKNLAPAFATTGGRLAVAGGGCDDGIAGVKRRLADFGGMCCPVKDSAAEGLPHLLVAHDLKAVVAHASNDVAGVSMSQLKAVARGRIVDWRELGGEAKPIAQVVRRHCPDYVEPVRAALLDNKPEWSGKALFVDTDEQIVDLVSRFPAAMGVVSWVFARPLVEAGKLRLLSLGGRLPDRDRSGYPLTGPLSMIFRGWDAHRMTPFFDFLYGRQGQEIVSRDLIAVSQAEAGYRGAATFGRA